MRAGNDVSSGAYLAVTDQTLFSTVFKWSGSEFVVYQKIDMLSPLELGFLNVNGTRFLAVR